MPVATTTKPKSRRAATSAPADADSLLGEASPVVPSSATGAPLLASREMGRLESIDPQLVDVGDNVRQDLGDLSELVESIREHGVLQPIKAVGPFIHNGRYELVWGQRRLRACQQLELPEIPVIVVSPATQGDDADRTIEQIVENAQRTDLNALDLARSFAALEAGGMSQAEIARRVGRSAPVVSNTLRILKLDPEVQQLIGEGKLTGSHANALGGLVDHEQQRSLARLAVDGQWSAHELERNVRWRTQGSSGNRTPEQQAERIRKRTAREANKLVKALEEGSVPKDAELQLGYLYDVNEKELRRRIKDAGWTPTSEQSSYGYRPEQMGALCDCRAYRYQDYQKKGWERVCTKRAHVDAFQAQLAAAAKRQAKDLVLKRMRIAQRLTFFGLDRLAPSVSRLVLVAIGGRRVPDLIGHQHSAGDAWPALEKLDDALVQELLAGELAYQLDQKRGWDKLESAGVHKLVNGLGVANGTKPTDEELELFARRWGSSVSERDLLGDDEDEDLDDAGDEPEASE